MRLARYKPLPYEISCYYPDDSPHFIQWWYFDAEFENGYHLMGCLLPRALGYITGDGNGPDPSVLLTINTPDLLNFNSRKYYPGEFFGDTEKVLVTIGQNRMEYRDGKYHLSLHQDGLGCDLEYIPELPPWAPLPGEGGYMPTPLIWFSQMRRAKGKYFHYASMIPRGKVKGTLTLPDGIVLNVEGQGYHEQGRSNVAFQNVFTYWYWVKFYLGDWTFIFPLGESPRRTLHAKMRTLLVYHRGEPVTDIFDISGLIVKHRVKRFQYHPASGREVPREATLWARWPGLKIRIDMELYHERECFLFQPFSGPCVQQSVWMQHLMRVKVDMAWKGRPINLEGEGIFETMLTGAT